MKIKFHSHEEERHKKLIDKFKLETSLKTSLSDPKVNSIQCPKSLKLMCKADNTYPDSIDLLEIHRLKRKKLIHQMMLNKFSTKISTKRF